MTILVQSDHMSIYPYGHDHMRMVQKLIWFGTYTHVLIFYVLNYIPIENLLAELCLFKVPAVSIAVFVVL